MEQATLIDVPPHNGVEDDNQRFTTDEADAWLRAKAGVDAWDLDVAACAESHRAPRFYTADDDGTFQAWDAERVFLNPPWDDIERWVRLAWCWIAEREPRPRVIGALLPGGRTHRPWWQKYVEPVLDDPNWHPPLRAPARLRIRHPPKRFAYGGPGNPRAIGVPEPNFTTVGLIWSRP